MKCNHCGSADVEVPEPPSAPDVYAVVLWSEGDATDLHKPFCRDCGSNDVAR